MNHSRRRAGEKHWLLSEAITSFDANQSSLSCQSEMMLEIYNKKKASIADAQCLNDVIALYLIHHVVGELCLSLEMGLNVWAQMQRLV